MSVFSDRADMFFSTIPGMSVESVQRVFFVRAAHERVAMLFGDDRCERDGGDRFVTLDDGLDAKDEMRIEDGDRVDMESAIEVDVQRRRSFERRKGGEERGECSGRRPIRGLGDVDAIDDRRRGGCDRVEDARIGNDGGCPCGTLKCRQLF